MPAKVSGTDSDSPWYSPRPIETVKVFVAPSVTASVVPVSRTTVASSSFTVLDAVLAVPTV